MQRDYGEKKPFLKHNIFSLIHLNTIVRVFFLRTKLMMMTDNVYFGTFFLKKLFQEHLLGKEHFSLNFSKRDYFETKRASSNEGFKWAHLLRK